MMDNIEMVSFKIYLIHMDSEEPEIRRFGLQSAVVTNYALLVERIIDVFPSLSGTEFKIFWKDEEGDDVAISSNEELLIALTSIKADLKKFYVRVQSSKNKCTESVDIHAVLHPRVFCDVCESNIKGFRYKCLVCRDYDLCSDCEQSGSHFEHPMLRISDPFAFEYINMRKLTDLMHTFVPEIRHHRRRHSRDIAHPDYCKKKKRCDKRESGHETGDESEEGCHSKKHSHKKCKKPSRCLYNYLSNDVLNYFNPPFVNLSAPPHSDANETTERPQEDLSYIPYLRSVGCAIQKLLDPFGVNVEFEVRPKQDEETKKKEKPHKSDEPKDPKPEEKTEEKKNETKIPSPTPSSSNVKEVRFEPVLTQQINEITTKLAGQTMNNADDGWVSFEELKKYPEEPLKSGETSPKAPSLNTNSPEAQESKSKNSDKQNIYPNLMPEVPDHVREAVDKMLSMGFTNEGHWLTWLVHTKDGNIEQVLEALSSLKKTN